MKFIVLKQGESLGDLADRIAARKGAPPKDRTLEALRDANPRLADVETTPAAADTLLMLPRALAAAAADRQQPSLPETLLDTVLGSLDNAFAALANVLAFEEQEAAAAITRIQDPEIAKLARLEPELQKELAPVAQRAGERAAAAKNARAAQATLLKMVGDDVAALRKAVLDRSPVASALGEIDPPPPPNTPGGPGGVRPVPPRDTTPVPGGGRVTPGGGSVTPGGGRTQPAGPAGRTVVGRPGGGSIVGRTTGGQPTITNAQPDTLSGRSPATRAGRPTREGDSSAAETETAERQAAKAKEEGRSAPRSQGAAGERKQPPPGTSEPGKQRPRRRKPKQGE